MTRDSTFRCPTCGALGATSIHAEDVPEISVVVPLFNEGAQAADNLRTIRDHLAPTISSFEFIAVDDGSSDNTWDELLRLRQAIPELIALRLSRNFGKEAAISAGLDASSGQACIVMDSDLQHPPELIPEMIRLWREEWDVVEGVKAGRAKEPLVNRWGASLFYDLLGRLSGYRLAGGSDFQLLDRKVVEAWQQMQERNTFFRGMTTWLGYRRTKLPFYVPARLHTQSRWSFLSLLRLALIAITAFSSAPLQIVTILGGLFLFCSLLFSAYALVLYFRHLALPGFTTIILLDLIIGGVLMVSLGIIGTYLGRIYDETKRRPRYLLAHTIDSVRNTARSAIGAHDN